MDPDRARDRLLWLEAEGLTIAAESRRLRRRLRMVRLVDAEDLAREIAELGIVARARQDEVELWRTVVEPGEEPTEAPARPRR
jgi:hypothetical protein